ncbi:MAG: hypothetical protein K2K60_01440 [Clostridia bacterium]|nr:hypothetical protein [Clostridia bacterium]
MKVVLDKKVFTLDEAELVRQFKAEWSTPTIDDIKSAVNVTAISLDIAGSELIAVKEIELTKNHYKPTYWVTVIIKGSDKDFNEIYAEMGFDYVQAILACFGDKIDNFTQIYKRV